MRPMLPPSTYCEHPPFLQLRRPAAAHHDNRSQVRAGSRLCRPALEGDGSSGASFFAGALSRQASEHSMSLKSYMEM